MYVSPIHVNYTEPIVETLKDKFDNEVLRAVQEVGIEVDKDELVKALQYDRGQYEKGYSDGRLYKPPVITNAYRIRAMTDEELAEFMNDVAQRGGIPIGGSVIKWFIWLEQEVEND